MVKIRNTFIIFLVSGFWHGANWTFIIWGVLNAVYFLPLLLTHKNRRNVDSVAHGRILPSIREFVSILGTFVLIAFSWIFFRAESVNHALEYIKSMFSSSLFTPPQVLPNTLIIFLVVFIVIEWLGREDQYAIQNQGRKWNPAFRLMYLYGICLAIMLYGNFNANQFIYFQF